MLTVLLATYNRSDILRRSLESYAKLIPPQGGWKIVVVDNGSTDDTQTVIDELGNALPLHYIREDKQGKNHALNRGLEDVEGDLIVFTDDDIIPDPRWLIELESIAAARPDYDLFGGVVDPIWPTDKLPSWLSPELPFEMIFGRTHRGLPDGEVRATKFIGANICIRRRLFDSGMRFDTSIGPASGHYAMGSETEFNQRAMAAGHKAWFHSAAAVGHIIRADQLNKRWVLARAFRSGRGIYRLDIHPALTPQSRRFLKVPLFLWKTIILETAGWLTNLLLLRSKQAFAHRFALEEAKGSAAEARRMGGS